MNQTVSRDEPFSGETLRLDKWLWHARFFKSRTQAASFCSEGRLRLNRRHIDRPSAAVRVGDVLTFALGSHIKVVRVRALGERRGPSPEARGLYEDLAPAAPRVSEGGEWKTTDLPQAPSLSR